MPRKRQLKQREDDIPEERVTRAPQGETEEHAEAVKIIPVLEKPGRMMERSMEENLLAFLDAFEPPSVTTKSSLIQTLGSRLPSSIARNDRRTGSSNLQQDAPVSPSADLGVFCHSVGHANPTVPTRRIHAAVFRCLKEATSHEVATRSFHLLMEFEKTFPRMKVHGGYLILNPQVWAPFEDLDGEDNYKIEGVSSEQAVRNIFLSDRISYEHLNWHELVNKLADFLDTSPRNVALVDSLVFKYLVDLLENDMNNRMTYFEGNHEIEVLQSSYFRKLLKGPDRAAAKDMFKNLQRIICASVKPVGDSTMAQLPCGQSIGRRKDISYLAEKLIIMFTNLGICEKEVQRSNLWDIVQEFPDDTEFLQIFLQALCQQKHKIGVITRQLHKKLTAKNFKCKQHHAEFQDIVKCLAEEDQALKICRAFKPDTLEVLLGHGFQACCLVWRLPSDDSMGVQVTTLELMNFCQSFKDALQVHQMLEGRKIEEVHIVARSALALAEMHCSR